MPAKPKLLVVTPRFPYPVIGGDRLRIYFLCKELSKHYSLTLLSLCESKFEMELVIPQDGIFHKVERVYLSKWRSYLNCLIALPSSTPLQVAYYHSHKFQDKVNQLLPGHDIALAHLVRTCNYLRYAKIPKVLEMTDAISLNYKRVKQIAKSNGIKNVIYSIEQSRLENYERNAAALFDLSVLVSSVDKDYLFPDNDLIREKVLVCSNGVDIDALPYHYDPDGKTIVFIGSMTTVQNLDAAKWFAKAVLPLLRKYADYTFKVVGRISEDHFKEFNGLDGVIATGTVDNISDAVKGAFAGVCPMRLGAGVQNKVLEYMALGLPTITSSLGNEGIDAQKDLHLLVADTPDEYVAQFKKLSNDVDKAYKLSKAGRSFVAQHHNWGTMLSQLIKRLEDI